MYETFYGFREKPFSLLPDAGFLYLSRQHRMALTLLEYGLMNQAGFTVISGDIGTGKTTLIRQLLNQVDSDLRIGLISNTHKTFGDLMQWIALAFDLPHSGKNKVELYQDFMDFIIREYAQGRRTVLIVDEAQNMSAETLEELRMLSNVNADKDQVLQIILVGQRELRETLQRPDLVQFAQRIGVDFHLEPLNAQETRDYIAHRCKTAGGKPDLFSDQACELVYRFTGGVPRLINLLCDTVLVYGYAEQRQRLDASLVRDVARDKQKSGLFPIKELADDSIGAAAHDEPTAGAAKNNTSITSRDGMELAAPHPDANPEAACFDIIKRKDASPSSPAAPHRNSRAAEAGRLRVAIAADSELLRIYLARLLTRFDIDVVDTLPLSAEALNKLDPAGIDVLHVELDNQFDGLDNQLYEQLENWQRPILFNDSLSTEASLSQPNRVEYGRKLSQKLFSLVPDAPQSVA